MTQEKQKAENIFVPSVTGSKTPKFIELGKAYLTEVA